jgi:hypothetical protein
MPLEDLTGAKYIDDLNENWPLGTDYPDAGDDHIRGVKNVLKRTFPNVTGPVNLSQDQLNNGQIPAGTRMLFFQATAPTGWARVADITTTRMLRLVASANPGGGSGGTDDPVLMDKVPSHTHTASGTATSASDSHTHTGSITIADGGAHTHALKYRDGSEDGSSNTHYADLSGAQGFDSTANTESAGNHGHTGTVTINAGGGTHSHTLSLTVAANGGAANWQPRYADVIVCEKS